MPIHGLSPEFILTVMGYCKSIDKLSMRYVEKTAASWQEKGIDTVPEAERYIDDPAGGTPMRGRSGRHSASTIAA